MRPPVTPPEPVGPSPDRPGLLKVVAAGVALEALLLVAAAATVGVELVSGGSGSVGVSVFLVLFFLGVAWALVAATRVLWRGRHGGRAPLVVWQVMQGLVGFSLLTGGVTWAVLAGVALVVVAAVVLVALMTRRVVDATSG
ncbi:hypothetical protein GCM10009809_03790 [Isoptericola hypogeus]|uniref:Integral membrane protein n=1 Tax=Isoptericola hypogeus TaxID=300179 RepID=A0ABN2IS38_9MICO